MQESRAGEDVSGVGGGLKVEESPLVGKPEVESVNFLPESRI